MKSFCLICVLTLTFPLILIASPENQKLKGFVPKTQYSYLKWTYGYRACLTVRSGYTTPNTVGEIDPCQHYEYQMWQEIVPSARPEGPVHLRVKHSEQCLTTELGQEGVFQSPCDESSLKQLWTVRHLDDFPFLVLYSEFAEKCLTGSFEIPPADAVLRPCGGSQQRWTYTLESDTYLESNQL